MGSPNLAVPLIMWGREPPTHDISCLLLTKDVKTIITGSRDGQICIWDFEPPKLKLIPRCLLVGHTAKVIALAQGSFAKDNSFFISSSENGEMCSWDLKDGRCLEVLKSANVHYNMMAYQMLGVPDARTFCIGNYPEILVYDPRTLDILFSLSARIQPDWISALHILRPPKRTDEVILGVTTGGWVKVWTVNEKEIRPREVIFEHESKLIHSLNALCLVCCAYNQRTVLIVTQEDWQIYDAGDFSQLCQVKSSQGERWMGGDFLTAERVLIWTDLGKSYIYKLPKNCIVESQAFHNKQVEGDLPVIISVVKPLAEQHLIHSPAWKFLRIPISNGAEKLLLRGDCDGQNFVKEIHSEMQFENLLLLGDCDGQVLLWRLMDMSEKHVQQIASSSTQKPAIINPTLCHSISRSWASMNPPPIGVLDQLEGEKQPPRITASLFLPIQGRLACGREDGSIILVPATETIMLHLLHGKHHEYHNWAQPMVLRGHQGRVNCLLYPHGESSRYDVAHLVSGGIDFSINVWNIYTGNLLHRFVVQAGQILQLVVPPPTCSPRIQNCVCSVAEDHSVSLVSIKEFKLVMLASQHLYPIITVKWRPQHDFLLVHTQDGSVYVWQMETGHLDRVLQGVTAEEVLSACDEHSIAAGGGSGADAGLANPAIHLFRGLRHRNLAAIRHAAQRGIHQILGEQNNQQDIHDSSKMRSSPLMIQGLRTNKEDANSHVLFFDIEALIVQLLSDEYALMSPETLEANDLIMANRYQKMSILTHPASPEAAKKIAEFLGKVKDKAGEMEKKMKDKDKHDVLSKARQRTGIFDRNNKEQDKAGLLSKVKESAESVQSLIQHKVDQSEKNKNQGIVKEDGSSGRVKIPQHLDVTAQTLQIGQMIMSLLHSWGLDASLDNICTNVLGLLRPRIPVSYGLISKSGFMALLMPTWHPVKEADMPALNLPPDLASELPQEMVQLEHKTQVFTSRGHWEISSALTTNHLLALVSVANTLQDMNAATLIPEQERRRKNFIQSSKQGNQDIEFERQQSIIKEGWSRLTALHTVLLAEKVKGIKNAAYNPPMVEILSRRWQDRCQEVREAAQALLKTELSRMGPEGRKALIEDWSPKLPTYNDPLPHPQSFTASNPNHHSASHDSHHIKNSDDAQGLEVSSDHHGGIPAHEHTGDPQPHLDEEHYDEDNLDGETCREVVALSEGRRKQATAIILLGVIGTYYGHDAAEGFGVGNLAMKTSKALAYLVLSPPNSKLPAHTPLRRAAIDLIGRGFPIWEPYLDVAKVLLALLELCSYINRLAPSMKYGLPLIPEADSCRTASNALTLMADARPSAFITAMAREVARYNALQQNAQSLQMNLHNSVLYKAKTEILRVMDYLIQHKRGVVMELMIEVMDIILHCVDPGHLKNRGLNEVFPSICGFPQVSHCPQTRRIATGAQNGSTAIYELRAGKCQMLSAHGAAVTALSFSPEGKYMATYSIAENKLSFWQTSTGMFGLGTSQTKCTKSFSTIPVPDIVIINPQRHPKLVWISNKTVVLMLPDGTEHRFNA